MNETLVDLRHIAHLARKLRTTVEHGHKLDVHMLNRLRDLAEKVQRHYDPKLAELGE